MLRAPAGAADEPAVRIAADAARIAARIANPATAAKPATAAAARVVAVAAVAAIAAAAAAAARLGAR